MHVQHADRHLPQSSWGCGRHGDQDSQVALRRKALLEVAATEAPQAPTASAAAVNAPACATKTCAASENSTYDLTAMRRQKGSLSILTQDGDTVQIRFRTNAGVELQSGTSSTSVHAFASGRVRVEVNGELDADELKAIGDLLDKVDSLATQFFDGDTQAAFSAAAELGFDAGEIAGYALRLSVKEYVRASVQATVAPPTATSDSTAAAPAPSVPVTGAGVAPAVEAPAPTPPAATVAAEKAPPADAPAPEAPAAPATPPSADPLATLQQTLGNFLKQVLDGLSSVSGSGRAEFSMRWKLQVMIEAVQSLPVAAASDPAGTALATDSLAKLATAQT